MPLGLSTKSRKLPAPKGGTYRLLVREFGPGGYQSIVGSVGPSKFVFPSRLEGTQITASENHPSWRSRVAGSFAGDIGGPFRTMRRSMEFETPDVALRASVNTSPGWTTTGIYTGPFFPVDPGWAGVSFPASYESSDGLLTSLGTTAISRVKPTKSPADVSTFLGELVREGLPKLVGASLWEEKTRSARKKAGHEYLNVEFGWKPVIDDVNDFIEGVIKFDSHLKQYERDAGRIVRRRYEFPTEVEKTDTTIQTNVKAFMPAVWSGFGTSRPSTGKVVLTTEKSRRRWFSGAFVYFLDEDFHSRQKLSSFARKAEIVFGTDITPEVLWNLAPWSWAADWLGNTGAVISNLTDLAKDGLVLKYGYMMEHSIARHTYTYVGDPGFPGLPTPPPFVLTTEVKKRVQATPYGFGLTWEGFSPRQLAILTALGFTRGK